MYYWAGGKQRGSSMVEVLVSTLVLAIGLLGLMGLQAASLRYDHSGYLKSIATAQLHSMADRMRSNQQGVSAGNYDSITGTASTPSCSACTAAQIAQRDHAEWNTNNASLLPSGTGTVASSGSVHVITVYWDAERTGATGTNCSGNTSVDLTCHRLSVEL